MILHLFGGRWSAVSIHSSSKLRLGLQQLNCILFHYDLLTMLHGYILEVVIISLLIHAVYLLFTLSSSHWLLYFHFSRVPASFIKTQYFSSFMLPSEHCQPLVHHVVKRVASFSEIWGWMIDIHDHFKFFVKDQLPEVIWNILCFLSSFTQALLFVWKRGWGFIPSVRLTYAVKTDAVLGYNNLPWIM